MAFDFTSSNSFTCLNRKRCFTILLLVNCFLGFLYYQYGKIREDVDDKIKASRELYVHVNAKQSLADIQKPINYIQSVLEDEYDYNDLVNFYQLADRQFSLGLRCTRNAAQKSPTTTTRANYTNDQTNKTTYTSVSTTSTTTTTLPTTTTTRKLSSNHFHQRSLLKYTIVHNDSCFNDSVDLLIMIVSKSDNYKTRDAIRRTWGSGENLGRYSSIHIKLFFLIDYDEKLVTNIRLEDNLFHDIVQVELPPQYTLVTYRVMAILEWSFRYCRQAKFLFKTDDDIFINLISLLKFVSPRLNKTENNSFLISEMTMYGYKHYRPGVFRQASDPVGSRYVITLDEFPCSHYPDFLSGFGYLIPKKGRDAIVYAAYRNPDKPFRISDVYFTGILPDYLSLERQPMADYTIRYQGNCDGFFSSPNAFACAAGLHHGDSSDVFAKFNRYWQSVRSFL